MTQLSPPPDALQPGSEDDASAPQSAAIQNQQPPKDHESDATLPENQQSTQNLSPPNSSSISKTAKALNALEQTGRQTNAKTQRTDPLATDNLFRTTQLLRQWDGRLNRDLKRSEGVEGLGQVPNSLAPVSTVTSVCGYCSTGCGLKIHLDENGEAINLSPKTEYPVNLGMACPKGWEAVSVLDAPDRATQPLLRDTDGQLKPVDWDTALKRFTKAFKGVQEAHGKESVAFLSTGQICTEEMALLGAVAKFGMGIKHGDGNTRQCMATSVVAYKQSFGFDAPPYTYADYEASDVLIFVGANPAIAHPIMWQRVWQNQDKRKTKPQIIVVDPRRSETAALADQHLPIKPKSDLVFFYGLAHILIRDGLLDQTFIDEHTNEFEGFAEHVKKYTPEHVAELSGIPTLQLEKTAQAIGQGKAVSFWWTMGVNQSYEGTRVAQAIINLALMTGNIGKPGTGANSITGQCNAMGSRLFSNTTNLLGGHAFENPDHRQKVADTLGIDIERIPTEASLAYNEIIEGIDTGKIKGLWFVATNGAHSWIHQDRFKKLMGKLDFLVVQDMYSTTETAEMADLVLPAAGWGEKDGTFINSERRIGPVTKVKKAPGQALSDFNILKLIAHYWGCGSMFKDWSSPEATFQILQKLSTGQPCDITGIDGYQMLHDQGGVQWPYSQADANQSAPAQERRLFEDRRFYFPDGRAKFIFSTPTPMPEPADDDYPFTLLTGRGTSSQWHTQTRTGKSAVLKKLYPKDPYAEIHPNDAEKHGIKPNGWIQIESRRGKINCRAAIMASVQPGQVFVPMHDASTNRLTHASFDPYSKQPSYKACAVKLHASHKTR